MDNQGPRLPRGVYVENSALDDFLRRPGDFGPGPFVISEYSLAEKARLPWPKYTEFLTLACQHLHLVRAKNPTHVPGELIKDTWEGPETLEAIDEQVARDGRRIAVETLEGICDLLADDMKSRYATLRTHRDAWLERRRAGNPDGLLNPLSPNDVQCIVAVATADVLGVDAPPKSTSTAAQRLRWHLKAWELALAFERMGTETDRPKDMRNDGIDGFHYALAATCCQAILVKDRRMRRIHDRLPPPRLPMRVLTVRVTDFAIDEYE